METTTTQTRKRRSRASNSADDNSGDDGKKRGRPRVDKQDESAADRRRTQIRMAQRAYRQRKESTLEQLRKRVSELSNTIELMNKAFLDCRDRLTASGLPASQMQEIQETAIQYEALMKVARNPGEEPDPDTVEIIHRSSTGGVETQKKPTEPKNVPSWMDEAVLNAEPKQRNPAQVGMGYTMYLDENDDISSNLGIFDSFNPQQSQSLVPTTRQPHPNSFDAFRVENPQTISLPATITPPRTYSFQESTFARRLHRACLEQGYQLLLDPHRRQATYERVFKLSLLSRDRNKLTAAIKAMLDKGPHEQIEPDNPRIHVGGAGTHFPRRDPFGNITAKKETWNLGVVGPQTLALLENAARDNLTTDMTVDIAGFEGEWFDSYDVEGYLNEKGIFIDPSSSFAEAEVTLYPERNAGGGSTTTTSTSPRTPPDAILRPQHPARPFDAEQLALLSRDNALADDWTTDPAMLDFSRIGFSDAGTGSWMNFLLPGESTKFHTHTSPAVLVDDPVDMQQMWEGSRTGEGLEGGDDGSRVGIFQKLPTGTGTSREQQQQLKKVIIIDVAKFVKVMTVSGVCIGSGPGFKRRDVDRALALSSFDAF